MMRNDGKNASSTALSTPPPAATSPGPTKFSPALRAALRCTERAGLLAGVHLRASGGTLHVISTDRYCMFHRTLEYEGQWACTLTKEAAKTLAHGRGALTLDNDTLSVGDTVVTVDTLSRFPDPDVLTPDSFRYCVTVARREFQQALPRCPVILSFDGECVMTWEEWDGIQTHRIPCQHSGPPIEMSYLRYATSVQSGTTIDLRWNTDCSPMLIGTDVLAMPLVTPGSTADRLIRLRSRALA